MKRTEPLKKGFVILSVGLRVPVSCGNHGRDPSYRSRGGISDVRVVEFALDNPNRGEIGTRHEVGSAPRQFTGQEIDNFLKRSFLPQLRKAWPYRNMEVYCQVLLAQY